MEVIKSNKGGEKLCLNGYMYVVHKECSNHIRWRCCRYSSLKCRANLSTTLQRMDPNLTIQHNHPANSEAIKVTKCVQEMKRRAKDTLAKPLQIYAEAVVTLENSTRAVMPNEESTKRTLRNHKSKNIPRSPGSLEELVIQGEWCNSGSIGNERFLLFDNGVDAEERIIIFATDDCLSRLANASTWYVDGNFSLAPPLFLQLYVIRVQVQGIFVTCAYSLLQRKTRSTYETMFRSILDNCEQRNLYPDPLFVNMDFEKAAMQAIHEVFGDGVVIKGCFYHLCQSTHRKIQEMGLERRYREDEEFSRFCGMLDALAFLPLGDIERGMAYLREHVVQGAEELLAYFDTTYISGTYRRVGNQGGDNIRLRNIPALFPPQTWNVHETTLQDADRTNNPTEGWNNRFSHLVEQKHPTIWKLILKLQQELASDQTKIEQRRLGRLASKTKKPAYIALQGRLKVLCEEYSAGHRNMENFLNAITNNIRF